MQDGPPLMVTMNWATGVATVAVSGELDPFTCAQLRDCLAWLGENRPQELVLDLGGVADRFVEQVTLLAVARRQLPRGCLLDIRSADPVMRQILELAGWTDVRISAGSDQPEPAPAPAPAR